jgi:hypothetical protein
MKPDTKLEPGDLVQLDPENVKNRMLAGMFMVVTEPKDFGAMGYITMPGNNGLPGGVAYYRPGWAEMELVGRAVWVAS